jgi:prepilin-type N-terminal cleavage/methylation domain-containing protein
MGEDQVPLTPKTANQATRTRQAGFSLLELLVALAVLLVVTAIVMSGLVQTSFTESTIANRTNMHASVRSATELLQQEIGQAGKISLPAAVTLQGAVTGGGALQQVAVSSIAGMFIGEKLIIDTGDNEETVAITPIAGSPPMISGYFYESHASGAPVRVSGAFASGIVPTTTTHGSTGSVLKLYGDINDDGNMVYIEYDCNPSSSGGTLTRSMTTIPASGTVPTILGTKEVLLNNVLPNPNGTSCFTYQTSTQGADTYVTNVAVTLTTQTQLKDLQTNQYQKETEALLNVSPRNVFEGWQLAEGGVANRIQPMPANVSAMLLLTPLSQ